MLRRLAWLVATQTLALACFFCNTAAAQENPNPHAWSRPQVEAYIAHVFGPQHAEMALAVSRAENSPRQCTLQGPVNDNGTVDTGVFMLNDVHRSRFANYDFTRCDHNIQVARILFEEEGWRPWTVYKTGAYRTFLARYRGYKTDAVHASYMWSRPTQTQRFKTPLPALRAPLPARTEYVKVIQQTPQIPLEQGEFVKVIQPVQK